LSAVASYDIFGEVFTKATYQREYALDQQIIFKSLDINADDYYSGVGNTDSIAVR